jgi:hypothetical protein
MNLVEVVVIIVVIIAIISFFFWKTKDDDKFRNYLAILSSLGIVLVFSTFILNYEQDNKKEKSDLTARFIELTSTDWNDIEKLFIDNYPYLERLYYQMYPTIPGIAIPEADPKERERLEQHACRIILRAIEEVFIGNGGLTIDWQTQQMSWLYSFQQWLSSQILRETWERTKNSYSKDTITFIDTIVLPGIVNRP